LPSPDGVATVVDTKTNSGEPVWAGKKNATGDKLLQLGDAISEGIQINIEIRAPLRLSRQLRGCISWIYTLAYRSDWTWHH
jgi:hypothetical protein